MNPPPSPRGRGEGVGDARSQSPFPQKGGRSGWGERLLAAFRTIASSLPLSKGELEGVFLRRENR